MKVTALIPRSLIFEVKELTNGKNITDSLIKALTEWVDIKKIKDLNLQVSEKPLEFKSDFNAQSARETNRS
ncbi:MAG: DUF2191 domain-containing protein [Candidatus Marinimicrobia bacterium]|jgi:hypothetical protein|nr:DUF2191 domain-containing protein [Candidatus Neomarinimicrobiota bacterium]MBT3675117.1 DUF2191 domain-containing protein [Candidatus Neomarinimicrobiota bacterium]MBT3763531.1 DUF2191 domain-containing protein [Candidatus Neomarinimicrobiota bacterium]MBT4067580.1 DUF2191 domain-containing protein [Candidatus Neomarinimicrobiota bacterium]MBT4270355.1 DUF2191 domain-containing protein [Candidatus Neomarinimicrobiota bacterium]